MTTSTTPYADPPLPFPFRVAGLVLILLGAMIVLAVASVGAIGALYMTLPHASASTTETLPIGAAPTLVLRGAAGDVLVLAGGAGEVRVDVTRRGRALTSGRAAEYLAQTAAEVTQDGSTVTVNTRAIGGTAAGLDRMVGSSSVHVTVWVPPATAVEARLSSGDLRLRNVIGPVQASVVQGDVRLEGARLSGANSISTETGDVNVDASLDPRATLDVRAGEGDARVFLPLATGAVLDAQASRGEVDVVGWPLVVQDVGGGQRATGPLGAGQEGAGAALRVQTGQGDVRVVARP